MNQNAQKAVSTTQAHLGELAASVQQLAAGWQTLEAETAHACNTVQDELHMKKEEAQRALAMLLED